MSILVIGCTGTVGSKVTEKLLAAGEDVRCLTRSLEKLNNLPPRIDGYLGDLSNPASLVEAFGGIEAMFLLLPVGPNETDQGITAVEEAKNADLRKIVYMSVYMPPDSTHIPHFRSKTPIEDAVKMSGIPYTILRPNNFFQNDLQARDALLRHRAYPHPIGQVGLNSVDVRDIADAAVNALTKPGYERQEYPLHGPDILTGESVARTYSRYLEQEVRYIGDNLDLWEERARTVMPGQMVQDFRIMYQYFQEHGFIAAPGDLLHEQSILDHEPRSFEDFVKEIAPAWKSELLVSAGEMR